MKRIFLFSAFLIIAMNLHSQISIKREEAIEDFDYFIKSLEETHPDPYSSFGGRPLFHKTALKYKKELEKDSATSIIDFKDLLTEFISTLKDGHTNIRMPKTKISDDYRYSPILFKCTANDIIIESLPKKYDSYKGLIGSKLVGINGINLDDVDKMFSKYFISENKYGDMRNISFHIKEEFYLNKILKIPHSDNITYNIITPNGDKRDIKLSFITNKEWKNTKWHSTGKDTRFQINNLSYRFVDKAKKIMYFKSSSIISRDCIEYAKHQGSDYYETLRYYYYDQHKEMPADTSKAILNIPVFADNFANMLKDMKRYSSPYLIIDLRGNGGGWTPIVLPSLYEMFGDDYLKANPGMQFYRIISSLYLKKFNTTIDDFNKANNSNYKIGDYTFSSPDQTYDNITEDFRKERINRFMCINKDLLFHLNGKPIYTPKKIYVITDTETFSAAYHYAFYLWKMGATIVGVPSSQSPNTFMEVTPLSLPNSKLNVSISNSKQLSFPENDIRANVFWPDIMLRYEDYKNYSFNDDSEVLYLIDKIENTLKLHH